MSHFVVKYGTLIYFVVQLLQLTVDQFVGNITLCGKISLFVVEYFFMVKYFIL